VHLAAGLLLADEAGAVISDEDGRPWDLDSRLFVIAASRALHGELMTLIRQ
jgi:fructose-1,6-bisphosphatase/inositol monophosphatase family enzyme